MKAIYSDEWWCAIRMDEEGTYKLIYPFVPDEGYLETILTPVPSVRTIFREIEPEDIVSFSTQNTVCRHVRKKATLAKMITALRNAVVDPDMQLRGYIRGEIEVVFAPEGLLPKMEANPDLWKRWIKPGSSYSLTLSDSFSSPGTCYGPEFYLLIRSLTPEDGIADP